jgi:hypothetical protein
MMMNPVTKTSAIDTALVNCARTRTGERRPMQS